MIRRPPCRWAAFTLVELLVVVAIIAVLIALLLPSLGKAREMGKSIVCQSNVRQMGMAFRMYADDQRQYFPPIVLRTPGTTCWYDYVAQYLGSRKVLYCPTAGVAGSKDKLGIGYTGKGWPYCNFTAEIEDDLSIYPGPYLRSSRAKYPAMVLVVIDSPQSWLFASAWRESYHPHDNTANIGFLDGHIGCTQNLLVDYQSRVLDVQMQY